MLRQNLVSGVFSTFTGTYLLKCQWNIGFSPFFNLECLSILISPIDDWKNEENP